VGDPSPASRAGVPDAVQGDAARATQPRANESPVVPRQEDEKTYEKPRGGFLAIGPRYPGVVSDDGLTVLFTHPGDAQWTEVLPVEYLEEAPDAPKPRHRPPGDSSAWGNFGYE